jgi:hypothetical protein
MGSNNRGVTESERQLRALALAQGVFYTLTGIWSLVDIKSFEKVTGPKTDRWLVKTVGVAVTAIGGTLLLAANRREVVPEVSWLAISSAIGLAGIDITYVNKRRISPVYLLDAIAELTLVGGWAFALKPNPHR